MAQQGLLCKIFTSRPSSFPCSLAFINPWLQTHSHKLMDNDSVRRSQIHLIRSITEICAPASSQAGHLCLLLFPQSLLCLQSLFPSIHHSLCPSVLFVFSLPSLLHNSDLYIFFFAENKEFQRSTNDPSDLIIKDESTTKLTLPFVVFMIDQKMAFVSH